MTLSYQSAIEVLNAQGIQGVCPVRKSSDNSIQEVQVVNPFFMPVVAAECEKVLGSSFKVSEYPNGNYIKITLKAA